MSNSLAIAAVTATLRNLLQAGLATESDLADVTITMQPLDRARTNGSNANQLNIFLYHVLPSGTWRNMDVPGRVRSGETAIPPLGLNLYYLLTAFGRDNDTQAPFSHQLMGRAMGILNDHPLLGSDEIKSALPNNDLWTQVERVRFTLQPYSIDEVAKIWTGFQTQYRLSVAYEAAVVLIDSDRPAKTPLPVLKRGPGDSGILAQANLLPPFPTLTQVTMPNQQTTVKLGDSLTLSGVNLGGDSVNVQFSNPRVAAPLVVPAQAGGSDQQVTVQIPADPANWPAGVYTASLIISKQGAPDHTSNELPLPIAPAITSAMPMSVQRVSGNVTLNLTCSPEVLPEQRVSLLLGDQETAADAVPAPTSALTFSIVAPTPGAYYVRLRVDGVDSQLINRTVTPPGFDDTQKVTIS